MTRTHFLVAILIATSATSTSAQSIPTIDVTTLRKLTQPGPHSLEFTNRVKFRVPDNLRYVTEDKLEAFMERLRLPLVGDEACVVVPADTSWYTIAFVPKDDPLAGQTDLEKLDRDELMKWTEKFWADHTARNSSSGRTYKVGNWTHTPKWDAETKTLEMGNRIDSESGTNSSSLINYKLFRYGPEKQIICLQTIAPITKWDKPVDQTRKLLDELSFPEVYQESSESEELMYYAKLVGGGVMGMLAVFVIAKFAMTGKRASSGPNVRRPGLPR